MFEHLEEIEKRYNEIENELTKPEVLSNIKETTKLTKELSELEDVVKCFKNYKEVLKQLDENKELLKDKDLGEMAKEEIERLNKEKESLEHNLEHLLIPKDPNDSKNVIMEIRGAAGGDEANIFAGDLFRMYTRYAEKKGFKYEVYNAVEGDAGGYAQIEFIIKGEGAYSKFKYESGSHRVQRVPKTESNGRLQTSTATVLVMPEAEEVDVEIDPKDLRIDIYRSSGKGGQGVNTTDSAVRIQNKEEAMRVLKARLYQMEEERKEREEGQERRSKIGTGDRAEKIRTYNYPQNRVTDHRIGFTTKNLDRVMDGDLDPIIDALGEEDEARKLAGEKN